MSNLISNNDAKLIENYNDIIYKYSIRRIYDSILNNKPSVELFNIGINGDVAMINKQDFIKNITVAMKYFNDTEQYEWSATCRDLIKLYDKTEVNNLLTNMEE